MNFWDLQSLSNIFRQTKPLPQHTAENKNKGFSLYQEQQKKKCLNSQGEEHERGMAAKVKNFEQTLNFQDLRDFNPHSVVKNPSNSQNQQGEDCQKCHDKELQREKLKKNPRNLKTISSCLYKYLNRNSNSSYTSLVSHFCSADDAQEGRQEIKNIRRRLYDAINVMLASGVVKKQRNHVSFNHSKEVLKTCWEEKQELSNYHKMIKQKEEVLASKRKILRKFNQITKLLNQLQKRNKSISPAEKQKFHFPISFCPLKQTISLNQTSPTKVEFSYQSHDIELFSEMQILEYLFGEY